MYSIQDLNKKIFNGHVLDELKKFPDESIDCVITSPPYWSLRDYDTSPQIWDADKSCKHIWGDDLKIKQSGGSGKHTTGGAPSKGLWFENHSNFCSKCGAWRGSLGLEPNFKLYIQHLIQIFNEIKRVLKKNGSCWINIGDSYSASGGSGKNDSSSNKYVINTVPHKSKDLPPKCLCQIPERFSIAMTDNGWVKRNTIIWHKPNSMPQSVKDRFTVDFEYFYFFTKNKNYYFEQQFEPHLTKENRPDGCIRQREYDYDGKYAKLHYKEYTIRQKRGGKTNPDYRQLEGKNKRTIWAINTVPYKEAHFAVFPERLVITPIQAGCPKDGIVLDPFAGSGTTLLVAEKLGRQWVGIELSSKYTKLAQKRIKIETQQMKLY